MGKLLPPLIEGTLPAFYGKEIIVPFQMNAAVGQNDISGFIIKIKTIYDNKFLHTLEIKKNIGEDGLENLTGGYIDWKKMEAHFKFEAKNSNLISGNSYKIQMAYKDIDENNTIGYYSTVGIIKYTTEPQIYIKELEKNQYNFGFTSFTGVYSQLPITEEIIENGEKNIKIISGGDQSERVYSYRFIVYDSNNQIHEESDELLHNHENDDNIYETEDKFILSKELEAKQVYSIQYIVKTINNLKISSPLYKLKRIQPISESFQGLKLKANLNQENAYIDLSFSKENPKTLKGKYLITRTDSNSNYQKWDRLEELEFFGNLSSEINYRDFTIQNGIKYKYAIQQINKYGLYSNKIYSNEVEVNFEHIYLYDGKRQLKIKYNPKISSFKETLQETKTNTLGGQFPFFFRNGNLKYKEFPVSGLISYLSDEEYLFASKEELGLDPFSIVKRDKVIKRDKAINLIENQKLPTTQLVDYNINIEQIFKNCVMDFLNNGEPKLFKSPIEGNYIVRLMNSSLTPNEQLGRMLHTFNTTATEIDRINYDNLIKYNILSVKDKVVKKAKQKTLNIDANINNILKEYKNQIIGFTCSSMRPKDILIITQSEKEEENRIAIGATGQYHIVFDQPIYQLQLEENYYLQGQIDIVYYDNSLSNFDSYKQIEEADITLRQFFGPGVIVANEKQLEEEEKDNKIFDNLYKENNINYQIINYPLIRFFKNDSNDDITDKINLYKVYIDDIEIDLNEIGYYEICNINPYYTPKIKIETGVSVEISVERYRIIKEEIENE